MTGETVTDRDVWEAWRALVRQAVAQIALDSGLPPAWLEWRLWSHEADVDAILRRHLDLVEAEQRTAPPRDDAGLRTRWHLAVAACALDVVEHVSA
ncbi:MAG TPA: hypothetical protein DCQ64_15820 [Candidatus Rokubacteria bacterium]|nr:hypothetical protein [Candidatus Rokubacteria bacterium]